MQMSVGFDSGSKWFDRYHEAYYEVIECYYKNLNNSYYDYGDLYKQSILPAAKSLARSTKGLYKSSYYNNYYEDFYKNYFNENSWSSIWSGYGYGRCDVDKVLSRWGFSDNKNGKSGGSKGKGGSSDFDTIAPPSRYGLKYADKITGFNSSAGTLRIDGDLFGVGGNASYKSAKNKRSLVKLAKKDFDFLYDEKKGCLYFNENGADKGFGDGGIIAVLKGAPDLNSNNLQFI